MTNPERAVVTDSTTSVDPTRAANLQKESGIPVVTVPSWITIKKEGVPVSDFSLDTQQFYTLLRQSAELFDTSGPNAGQFTKAFEKLAADSKVREIFTFLSDGRLTCGANSANTAAGVIKESIPEMKIHVLDTKSVSVGASILIPEAIELMKQGLSFEEISQELERRAQGVELFVAISDANFLFKSAGRRFTQERLKGVKTAVAALAISLKIYPIVTLKNAELVPLVQTRGKEKILGKLIGLVEDELDKGKVLKRALVTHTNWEGKAKELADLLAKRFSLNEETIDYCEAGKVLAVYTGQECLGLACLFQ